MKISRLVWGIAVLIVALSSFTTGARFVPGQHGIGVAGAPAANAMPLGLPSAETAKDVLNASLMRHHPQWVDVPMGSVNIRTFAIYPDHAAPVMVVTSDNQGMSDWVRAVGTAAVNEGFVAIVPDVLSGMGPNGGGTDSFANREAIAAALRRMGQHEIQRRTKAVRDFFVNLPGSNGKSAILDFNWRETRLHAAISTPTQERVATFDLTEHAWHNALAFLTNLADPAAVGQEAQTANPAPTSGAAEAQRAAQQALAKSKDFPPQSWNAKRMADEAPRHGQWVDIRVPSAREGTVMLHTWVVQPLGTDKAPVIVVIHPGPGMDIGDQPKRGEGANWMRAAADALAAKGFIAVVPDLSSGLGPNGGNFDSFVFPDDVGRAVGTRSPAERMDLIRAARDYANTLPRATGKSGTTGFCNGGGMAWESTAAIPGVSAAVAFYGGPPPLAVMAKIQAPVLALAGDQDPGLAPRVSAAAADMQKLGKVYEFKIYPDVTHAFLHQQTLGQNAVATLDGWTRAIAFFDKYLK
jgi:carboxymethylenebutenolidase